MPRRASARHRRFPGTSLRTRAGFSLRELAGLDLEYRLRAGELARVEELLDRFPALRAEHSMTLELITLEYRVRASCAEPVGVAEYLKRFPPLRDKLSTLLEPLGHNIPDVLAAPQQGDEIGRLGHYRVLSVLGRGGMGVVLLGHDPHLDRQVAIKLMLSDVAKANRPAYASFVKRGRRN